MSQPMNALSPSVSKKTDLVARAVVKNSATAKYKDVAVDLVHGGRGRGATRPLLCCWYPWWYTIFLVVQLSRKLVLSGWRNCNLRDSQQP